ncbi:MAG: putative minor tail protein [Prokaryotic dsDNA virus sp.]|nr:MAG: putative minor tail protein [Prokaryotic dsDNA virus sp.]|tara:strand:+ start:4604 stop:8530 length:3927 start_codon:yes stop_codon:yes gene_type:complete
MTRVGASQVFFNVVAGFNARKLIQDHRTAMNVMRAVSLDSFEAMLKPIEDVSRAIGVYIGELKQVTIEMGKAQVEFEKFYGGQDADILAEELKEVGLAYAKVGTEALSAGSRAAQVAAIVGEENIPLLVEQAEILSNISDLNSEEAMKGIIKLQQQTGILYGDLNAAQFQRLTQLQQEKILTDQSAFALDALNTIANRSVAVEGELVETMTNFAAQGALVKESFEDMAAMSAVLLEAGEEAGAAGRALRMIYARMGGDIGGARSELEALGVEVINTSGDMNTMRNITQQLVDMGWDRMTSAQKQNIAQTIAGNRHYVRFIKLMENQARAVELAEQAVKDVDSASGQAEKAMESFAYQMERADAAAENMKASMGESLSPFLIAQKEAKNDILEMQVAIADTFGEDLLRILGRMTAFGQLFGGFVKFGLGIQSLAIGMGMFESVQRDLHGILIANETLHSKQATYFDFNVQATEEEKVLLQAIQYHHQLINRHRERANALTLQIKTAERENLHLFDEKNRLEEYGLNLDEQSLKAQRELNSLASMYNIINESGAGNRMDRILYFNQQLIAQGSELTLQKQYNKIFNEKSAAHEAHMRRVVLAHDQVKRLSKEDVIFVERKNRMLKQQTDAINTLLIAEQTADTLREKTFTGGGRRDTGSNIDQYHASRRVIVQLNDAMAKNASEQLNMANAAAVAKSRGKDLSDAQDQYVKDLEHEARMYNHLETELNEYIENYGTVNERRLNIDRQSDAALRRLGETTLGHQMQTDSLLKTVDLHGMMIQRQTELQSALNTLENESVLTKGQMHDILLELGPVTEEIEQAIRELAEAQRDLNLSTKERTNLENIIKDGLADTAEETKHYANILGDEGLEKAQVAAADSARKFGFALSSVSSIAIGMIPGVNAATASTVMMSTTLIPALGSLAKTTKDFITTQKALILANATAGNSFLSYAGKVTRAMGPLVLITGALAVFNDKQAKSAKALEVAENFAMEHDATLLDLQNNTHLFSDETEYLAEKLGITNHSLKELRDDSDLLEDTIGKLEEGMDGLDGSQEAAIDSALRLADALYAISTGAATLNDEMIDVSYATIDEAYEGLSEISNTLDETALRLGLDYGGDRIRAGDKLVESGLFSDDAIEKHYSRAFGVKYQLGVDVDFEQLFAELQDMHERGERLSKDEIKALGTLIDDAEIYGAIVAINNSILTESSEAGLFNKDTADDATENIGNVATALANLTEDVYDFGNAREELFFGGKYGNVTGSLYKQVVKQGVGVLYNKMDIVMSNNFHGFFNEREAAERIRKALNEIAPSLSNA